MRKLLKFTVRTLESVLPLSLVAWDANDQRAKNELGDNALARGLPEPCSAIILARDCRRHFIICLESFPMQSKKRMTKMGPDPSLPPVALFHDAISCVILKASRLRQSSYIKLHMLLVWGVSVLNHHTHTARFFYVYLGTKSSCSHRASVTF